MSGTIDPSVFEREMERLYGTDPGMVAIDRLRKEIHRAALYTPPVYLMPLSMAGITDYKPLEKTMTTPDNARRPIKLLVDALKISNESRSGAASCGDYHEKTAKEYRAKEAKYKAEVDELTKALKKLGHKV